MENEMYFLYENDSERFYEKKDIPDWIFKVFVSEEVEGASGGSCWGDKAEHYTNITEVTKEDLLLHIAEEFITDLLELPYFKVKQLEKNISVDYESYQEYYGNWSKHRVLIIKLLREGDKFTFVEK